MTVSEVALGCEGMIGATPQLVNVLVTTALESGMNFLDNFCAEPDVRDNLGASLKGDRQDMYRPPFLIIIACLIITPGNAVRVTSVRKIALSMYPSKRK